MRRRTGVDLGGYKTTTIRRRIARRLAATGTVDLPGYLAYVDEHPDELDRLQQELLISVTAFFRDRVAFDALADSITELVREKPREEQVRVWVAGCATGEEAYSIAILLLDALQSVPGAQRPRIFATDIDVAALQHARRGLYPEAALAKVRPTLGLT